ncbi:unnamed protein product [marine sediment metagenome]|uniref:RNase H type-1 domain-containing protein n=1 Tax=marine sediment metagenome TaxID=412755 RepID=X1UCP1_9ZZZZ
MAQLNFLSPPASSNQATASSSHWTLFIDGASRNNPGPAGAGFYVLKDSEVFAQEGYFLGSKTNNQAEYLALIVGLAFVQKHIDSKDTLRVVSDSQLVVRQLLGEYRVKNLALKPLFLLAHDMIKKNNAHVMHVLRTENTHADEMANVGIDKKKPVPSFVKKLLEKHAISL